jgi:hypothetical protein
VVTVGIYESWDSGDRSENEEDQVDEKEGTSGEAQERLGREGFPFVRTGFLLSDGEDHANEEICQESKDDKEIEPCGRRSIVREDMTRDEKCLPYRNQNCGGCRIL